MKIKKEERLLLVLILMTVITIAITLIIALVTGEPSGTIPIEYL